VNAAIIGISTGLLIILTLSLAKRIDKAIIYGLILSGIAFLYVGFTWSDVRFLIITSVQALFFVALAYYGVKKSLYFLIAGYFLHGIWDLGYDLFPRSNLIPPHYDLFCLSVDFVIGFYLLFIQYRAADKINNPNASQGAH
jgi:hypothetical protein